VRRRRFFASSIIGLISLTPAIVALSSLKEAPDCLAKSLARVVLPQLRDNLKKRRVAGVITYPGGPQNIMDPVAELRTRESRRDPDPVKCSWPMKSSRTAGRRRSARGSTASAREDIDSEAVVFRFFADGVLGEAIFDSEFLLRLSADWDTSFTPVLNIGASLDEDEVPIPLPVEEGRGLGESRHEASKWELMELAGTSREQMGLPRVLEMPETSMQG